MSDDGGSVGGAPSGYAAQPSSGSYVAPRAVGQFAVDDEPEDAAAPAPARVATLEPVREGQVLPDREVAPSAAVEDEEEFPPDGEPAGPPVPPVIAPRIVPATSGVQRYGEAVVRQVLGARFVREESYESPTRFS